MNDSIDRETALATASEWDREPWEPWEPRVGQRVRCAPSPECDAPRSGGGQGHWEQERDRLGTIVEMPRDFLSMARRTRHHHAVVFDDGFDDDYGGHVDGCLYTAWELEPLDRDDVRSARSDAWRPTP